MMVNDKSIKAIVEFLNWIENNTYYEIGEDIQSDYGDGESYFHRIDLVSLVKEYRESFK